MYGKCWRPSFLSNTAKLHQVWPELFTVDSKKLPYHDYMWIAVSSLEPHQKNENRSCAWKENRNTIPTMQTIEANATDQARWEHIYKVEIHIVEGVLAAACKRVEEVREELCLPHDCVQTPRGVYTYVNAMRRRHPRLLQAEAEQRAAIRQHNAVLAEGAELGRKLGYIR